MNYILILKRNKRKHKKKSFSSDFQYYDQRICVEHQIGIYKNVNRFNITKLFVKVFKLKFIIIINLVTSDKTYFTFSF